MTFDSFNGAKIDVQASGGFAGLSTHYLVSHDDRAFLFTSRRLCDTNCGAAIDSTSGTLSGAAADSLFNIVLSQDPFNLKDDYGPTRGGADMFDYTVRITADGRTKSVHFDDGTMPEAMRRILEGVRGTVSGARK
ncbi:MAG: protealysin inhibitor emfourin [bacterium]